MQQLSILFSAKATKQNFYPDRPSLKLTILSQWCNLTNTIILSPVLFLQRRESAADQHIQLFASLYVSQVLQRSSQKIWNALHMKIWKYENLPKLNAPSVRITYMCTPLPWKSFLHDLAKIILAHPHHQHPPLQYPYKCPIWLKLSPCKILINAWFG